jgi:hypothetical protein
MGKLAKKPLSAEVELWEKQPGETAKAYHGFCVYRDLGYNRTYKKTGAILGCTITNVFRWSFNHSWKERVEAWDGEIAMTKRNAQLEEIEQMSRRQANQSAMAGQALMVPVLALVKRLKLDENLEDTLANMPIADLITLVTKVTQVYPNIMKSERLARGEATELVKSDVTNRSEEPEQSNGDAEAERHAAILRILSESGAVKSISARVIDSEDDAVLHSPAHPQTDRLLVAPD